MVIGQVTQNLHEVSSASGTFIYFILVVKFLYQRSKHVKKDEKNNQFQILQSIRNSDHDNHSKTHKIDLHCSVFQGTSSKIRN